MSTNCIDTEARDRIAELALKHEKLEGAVWGPHGENGLRSRVAELEDWKAEVCPRLDEFGGHVASCQEAEGEEVQVKVAKIQAGSANVVQGLTLLGVILMALLQFFKK